MKAIVKVTSRGKVRSFHWLQGYMCLPPAPTTSCSLISFIHTYSLAPQKGALYISRRTQEEDGEVGWGREVSQ